MDAIFVTTRRRPVHLYRLLLELQSATIPLVILATERSDVPASVERLKHPPLLVFEYDEGPDRAPSVLPLPSSVQAVSSHAGWDLPRKRNYALWFARTHGLTKVLLIDDDIRGVSPAILDAGARALDQVIVAGPYVEAFPDLSVVGHAMRHTGEAVQTFLSGSCLFVRAPSARAFFPEIYNEDWLFLLPFVSARSAANVGQVRQIAYDPFKPGVARFQEFGEVIADGLYCLLCHGRFAERLDEATWQTILSLRRKRLRRLIGGSRRPEQRGALEAAFAVVTRVRPRQCTQFVEGWDRALQTTAGGSTGMVRRGLAS